MGRELGRFLEHRRKELGLSRKDLSEATELSYAYVSQLETGDREPRVKTMHALAQALQVSPSELAALVAGADWTTTGSSSYASAAPPSRGLTSYEDRDPSREKLLLALERRLRDVPPVERISVLNELIAAAVEELR